MTTGSKSSPRRSILRQPSWAARLEKLFFILLRAGTYGVLLAAAAIFLDIGIKGGRVIFQLTPPFVNVPFLTQAPETLNVFKLDGATVKMGDRAFRAYRAEHPEQLRNVPVETYVYSAGGIFPNIVGTVLLVVGSMVIALVLGVASAIYLSEYAKDGPFIRLVRLSIANLAGVPSIVFGLFGFGLFVVALDWNVSLLAGWFTLAFMVLPIVITASEEALRSVPKGFREGALALGATKFQTIRTNVLPYALPGILTSSVLAIARVAGETAPIMFTAAYVVRDRMPWQVDKWTDFFFQGVMALPYHIYVVASKIPQNDYTRDVQYGTAFVFLFTVAAIALTAILLRARLRKQYRW
ncbi:MAG: phosphate ABC transporter permease PstA [Opitutaceae bacterium]